MKRKKQKLCRLLTIFLFFQSTVPSESYLNIYDYASVGCGIIVIIGVAILFVSLYTNKKNVTINETPKVCISTSNHQHSNQIMWPFLLIQNEQLKFDRKNRMNTNRIQWWIKNCPFAYLNRRREGDLVMFGERS